MDKLPKAYSFRELNNMYKQIDQLIDSLDELAIRELLSGSEKDLDGILKIIMEEADAVLTGTIQSVGTSALNHLPQVSRNLDEYLRRFCFNYFKSTVLTDYDMWIYDIEWGNYVQLYNKLLILAGRGLGKTFAIDMAYTVWTMYRYRKNTSLTKQPAEIRHCEKGVSITNTFKLARDVVMHDIKKEIENNDILREVLLPNRNEGKWGNTEILCKNGASWTIRSADSEIRGLHTGKIILDDYLNDSVIYSKEQNRKYINKYNGEIAPVLNKGGNIIVIGTPYTDHDWYSELKKNKDWKCFEYPAFTHDGLITNPLRFDMKYYQDAKYESGTPIFSREHLCKPITDSSSIFPYEYLRNSFIGMDKICMAQRIQEYPVKFSKVVCGCDFAKSAAIGADYTVYSVVGLDSLQQYHLVYVWRKQGASYNEQISAMQYIQVNFSPDTFLMEANNFQKVMVELAKDHGIYNAEPFVTTGWNKKDPNSGLPSLSARFERGQIKFPRGDEYSRNITDIYCSEFNSITYNEDSGKLEAVGEHDDCPMSLLFSIIGMNAVNSQLNINYL